MKIVVIGGTGLIGAKVVGMLEAAGHEALAASPRKNGVNAVTGERLEEALTAAQVVVDVANAPSWKEDEVLEFFRASTRNLLAAEQAAGVRHHVALSIVGTDRMPDNGYFRAKLEQERLIQAGKVPYTIVRATQFIEFLGGIADFSTSAGQVRLAPGLFQPIAADDVAALVAEAALAQPRMGIVDIAGPERAPLCDVVGRYLKLTGDPREVVMDPAARYYGGTVEELSLVPLGEAKLGKIGVEEWVRRGRARPD